MTWDAVGSPGRGEEYRVAWYPTIAELDFWQQEKECSSMPHGAFNPDYSTMIEDNVLHDCQTQTGATAFTRPCFIHAVKAFEDPGQVLRRDTRPVIAHKEFNAIFTFLCADYDLLSTLRVTESIADEVAEDLLYGIAICQDGPVWYVFDREFNLGGAGILLQGRSSFRKQLACIVGTQIKLFLARFHPRQHQQVFRQAAHALGVAANDLHEFARALVHGAIGFQQGLGISLDRRERRPQFVGNVGDEVTACFFYPLNFGNVVQHAHHAAIGQRLRCYGKRSATGKGGGNRALPVFRLQDLIDCGKEVRMAKKLNHGNADADRLVKNAGNCVIGPAHFQVRGDGDHSVGHAVEQCFKLRAALLDGGKVFFQPAGCAIERHGDLGNLVAAGFGDARREIAGGYLLGKTDNAAQPPRNDLCYCRRKHERQKQGEHGRPQQIGANRGNLLLHAGERIGQANNLVTAWNGEIKELNANSVAQAGRAANLPTQCRRYFRPAGMVLHGFGIGFRICKDDAVAGYDGDARFCYARFFISHLLQRMLAVILNAKREALRILDKKPFNITVDCILPGVPDADIQRERGSGYHRDKCAHGFQENAVSHFTASNLYPAPRTVLRYRGSSGSCSIFSRSRRMYTSTERGVTKDRSRHTASSTWSRV